MSDAQFLNSVSAEQQVAEITGAIMSSIEFGLFSPALEVGAVTVSNIPDTHEVTMSNLDDFVANVFSTGAMPDGSKVNIQGHGFAQSADDLIQDRQAERLAIVAAETQKGGGMGIG